VPEFPEETFPQSILDVPLETILHPAVEIIPDLKIPNLTVPAFYDPPHFQKYNGVRSYLGNYGESLMTLEQAQNIGSKVNGLETIFVAITSYRGFQCRVRQSYKKDSNELYTLIATTGRGGIIHETIA
jgi:hypothetical protein